MTKDRQEQFDKVDVRAALSDERKREIRHTASQLEDWLLYAVLGGLPSASGEAAQEIEERIRLASNSIAGARAAADESDDGSATRHLVEAAVQLTRATEARGLGWRVLRSGMREAICLVAFCLVVLILALGWTPSCLGWELVDWPQVLWGVPLAAFGWGALGATLRSLYWVSRKVSKGQYLPRFATSYICAPFVGALFGAFIYLLSEAGLFILDGDTSVGNEAVPLALAFLAGFNWESVLDWVKRFGSRSSSKSSES